MKTFKTFITLLLLTIGMAAQAQQKVVIELNDGTSEAYDLADVDSVTYEPKEEVKFYYYAGWELPKTKEELVKYAVGDNGKQINPEDYEIGKEMKYFDGTSPINDTFANYYLVVPDWVGLFDSEGLSTLEDTFDIPDVTISNYKIFKSRKTLKKIAGIMLKRIK